MTRAPDGPPGRGCHSVTSKALHYLMRSARVCVMASSDASSIYIRMPADLKRAVDDHARGRGSTVTAAAVDLLGRGLQAVTDEKSVADLETALAGAVREKAVAEAELVTARAQLAT